MHYYNSELAAFSDMLLKMDRWKGREKASGRLSLVHLVD